MENSALFKTLYPLRFFRHSIENETRFDGRCLLDSRSREISYNPNTASSLARIGSTLVQTTIKLTVVQSAEARIETRSKIGVHFEISPLCHYSRNKTQPLSKQLGYQLQQLFDSESIVDPISFRVSNSRSEFRISLHVTALDLDGAIFETSLFSCLYALLRFNLPVVEVDTNGNASITENRDENKRIELQSIPIGFRFGIFESKLLSDPTEEEETFMDGLMTIIIDQNHSLLNVWQNGCFGSENFEKAISLVVDGYDRLQSLLLSFGETQNVVRL